MDSNKTTEIIGVIRSLQAAQVDHLNRQLAIEAMLQAMLCMVDPKVLPRLAETYEVAKDRLAEGLLPLLQRPKQWSRWSDLLEELQQVGLTVPEFRPQAST